MPLLPAPPTSAEDQVLNWRNEEEPDGHNNDKEPLEEPESILHVRPRVSGTADTDHHQRHEEEEASHSQQDAVGREVANDVATECFPIGGRGNLLRVDVD